MNIILILIYSILSTFHFRFFFGSFSFLRLPSSLVWFEHRRHFHPAWNIRQSNNVWTLNNHKQIFSYVFFCGQFRLKPIRLRKWLLCRVVWLVRFGDLIRPTVVWLPFQRHHAQWSREGCQIGGRESEREGGIEREGVREGVWEGCWTGREGELWSWKSGILIITECCKVDST